jgi:hypothetical protein
MIDSDDALVINAALTATNPGLGAHAAIFFRDAVVLAISLLRLPTGFCLPPSKS